MNNVFAHHPQMNHKFWPNFIFRAFNLYTTKIVLNIEVDYITHIEQLNGYDMSTLMEWYCRAKLKPQKSKEAKEEDKRGQVPPYYGQTLKIS